MFLLLRLWRSRVYGAGRRCSPTAADINRATFRRRDDLSVMLPSLFYFAFLVVFTATAKPSRTQFSQPELSHAESFLFLISQHTTFNLSTSHCQQRWKIFAGGTMEYFSCMCVFARNTC